MTGRYIVEPLSRRHDRENFDCGEPSLNEFLKRFARQNDEKGIGRTFVAVKEVDPKIYGYYTLSGSSVKFELIPESLPRYPVPFIHLGRLAVDISAKGDGLGKALLFHAFNRAVKIAEQLGIYAVEVFALNENAREFYLQFGLRELKDDELHLYITIKDIRKLMVD